MFINRLSVWYVCLFQVDLPSSSVMVLIGIMLHLCARERMNRGRREGDIGPAGPIGFSGFGSSLCFFLLSSLPTYNRTQWILETQPLEAADSKENESKLIQKFIRQLLF